MNNRIVAPMDARNWGIALLAVVLCACGGDGGDTGGGGTGGGGTGGGGTGGGSTGGGSTGGGGGQETVSSGAFPDLNGGSNGQYPQLVIGPTGTRHFLYELYSGPSANEVPFRYGECTSNCNQSSSWTFIPLGNRGYAGGFGNIALDASGKPRVVWVYEEFNPQKNSPPATVYFASCDSDCTNAASWQQGPIKVLSDTQTYKSGGRNLSVDGTGRVHLVYALRSTYVGGPDSVNYLTCASTSNCAAATSWSTPVTLADSFGTVSLATTAAGQVRVAYMHDGTTQLRYRACDGGCESLSSWGSEVALYVSNVGRLSLRLNAQGFPRLVFNTNGAGPAPNTSLNYYAWCDAGCGESAQNWDASSISFADQDGRLGLDFDLHSNGAVTAAIKVEAGSGLGIVSCLGGCESRGASWTLALVEDDTTLVKELAAPLPVCPERTPPLVPRAFWYPGEQTSVAINPLTQKLEVAHFVYTLSQCGITLTDSGVVKLPRYSGPF